MNQRDETSKTDQIATFAGCSKRPSSKAAGEDKAGGVPLWYVEDLVEPKTQLAGFFSSLLQFDRH